MSIEGRTYWTGKQPGVIKFTDNGKRKVVLRLPGDLSIDIEVDDAEALSRDLSMARIWVKEG